MRNRVSFAVIILALILVGCGGPSYDKEGFKQVQAYADEMIPLADGIVFETIALIEERNPSTFEKFESMAEELRAVNKAHWTPRFTKMADEEAPKWLVSMSQGQRKWTVDGKKLSSAVFEIEADTDWLASELQKAAEGDMDPDRLARAMELTNRSVAELRFVLYDR